MTIIIFLYLNKLGVKFSHLSEKLCSALCNLRDATANAKNPSPYSSIFFFYFNIFHAYNMAAGCSISNSKWHTSQRLYMTH